MNAEYLRYCLGTLTDQQFAVYCTLQAIPLGQTFTLAEVAEIMGRSPEHHDRLRTHFKNLEHKKFIIYRSMPGQGHELLWIRTTAEEKAPLAQSFKLRACEYVVCHPEHGRKKLTHGNIRAFVERHGLKYRAFRAVLSGDRNHHHEWRMSK